MWAYRSFGGYCDYEPITKEEKIAILDIKETFLKAKLERIRKVKESLTSDKSEKEESDEE